MGMEVILGLIGGLGLFLYGMKLMGDGLQKVAGAKMRSILEKLTKNRFIGMMVGLLFTAVIQSSSATTVLVVSFVDAGLMKLSQAAGVILGANIGTTITGQLIALNLSAIAPVFIMAGVVMVMFVKKPSWKKMGEVVLGFGVLFFGMSTMSSSISIVKDTPYVINLMASLESPMLALLVGFLVTAVMQSSSATVGIVIVLASQGLLPLGICFYLIMGCNVGSCVSALLASLGGKKMAKRAALIHFLINIFGTTALVLILAFFKDNIIYLIQGLTSGIADPGIRMARDVANAHTIFKIVEVILLFPFAGLVAKLTYLIIPGDEEMVDERHLQFIGEHSVYSPTAAVPQTICEIERMGHLAFENLDRAMEALLTKNDENLDSVYQREATIDYMNTEIINYLLKINQLSLPVSDRVMIGGLFHVVSDIERIGDHAENIADYTKTMIDQNLNFSEEAVKELAEMYQMNKHLLELSMEMFAKRSEQHLQEIMKLENNIDEFERELQNKHIERLTRNECGAYAGTIFSDLCSNLERVGDHATNIAFSILENDPEPDKIPNLI
ncbi:MAG: Na/Pi cotransporter family protein [Acetivibrio sp.]